jgi:hypothetical protein
MSKIPYNIARDYKRTGYYVTDAIASCLIWHQHRKIGVKSISLNIVNYYKFLREVEEANGGKIEEGTLLQFNGVDINKGSFRQPISILVETFNDYNRNLGINTDPSKEKKIYLLN